jgi:dephospho-CoA kinase
MIKLGLSGNRYSGKNRVSEIFEKIGVPVFDADTVLKFILQYNYDALADIRKYMGSDIFIRDSLDIRRMDKETFDKVLNFVEVDLFNAYQRFEEKYSTSIYTVFNSSILFEKEWDNRMDLTVSVFAPKTDRIKRCKAKTNQGLLLINDLIKTEMDELSKNEIADYTIHNYDEGNPNIINGDILKQVSEIDQKIIDEYLYKEQLGCGMVF